MDASCDGALLCGVFMREESTPDCRVAAAYALAMTPSDQTKIHHEINNVLAAMMAEAQLLQLDVLTPNQTAGLNRIVAHTRRMRDLLRMAASSPREPDAH